MRKKKEKRVQVALEDQLYIAAKKTLVEREESWQSLLPRLIDRWIKENHALKKIIILVPLILMGCAGKNNSSPHWTEACMAQSFPTTIDLPNCPKEKSTIFQCPSYVDGLGKNCLIYQSVDDLNCEIKIECEEYG